MYLANLKCVRVRKNRLKNARFPLFKYFPWFSQAKKKFLFNSFNQTNPEKKRNEQSRRKQNIATMVKFYVKIDLRVHAEWTATQFPVSQHNSDWISLSNPKGNNTTVARNTQNPLRVLFSSHFNGSDCDKFPSEHQPLA